MCGAGGQRLGIFTIENLHTILKNKAYIGLKVYEENGETKTAKACWDSIVTEDFFNRVQALLKKHYKEGVKITSGRRYPFLLGNLTVCGQCGNRLPGKSAHGNGGKIPYYEHGWAVRRQAALNKKIFTCQPHRILAKIIEPLVWEQIHKLLIEETMAKELLEEAKRIHQSHGSVAESDRLRNKLMGVEEQTEALAEHLSKIPKGISPVPIYNQMEKMELLKKSLSEQVSQIMSSEDYRDEPASLKDFQRFLDAVKSCLRANISPDEKAKIARALLHKVEVFPEYVKIHYKVGESVVGPINSEKCIMAPTDAKSDGPSAPREAPSNFSLFSGSNKLTNGWGARIRT